MTNYGTKESRDSAIQSIDECIKKLNEEPGLCVKLGSLTVDRTIKFLSEYKKLLESCEDLADDRADKLYGTGFSDGYKKCQENVDKENKELVNKCPGVPLTLEQARWIVQHPTTKVVGLRG